jgi:hypothetical protein
MKNYFLFVFFIISLTSYVSAQTPIKIDVTSPENVNAGEEFILNVEVNKNKIYGFAKLELYLPVGFKYKIIDAAGSTVISQNQLLKLIWIDLPDKEKFSISISIFVDNRIKGYKEIFGNFHYLLNRERKKYPIAVVPLNVINENTKQKIDLAADNKSSEIVLPKKNIDQKIVYRVQIAANKKKINKEILQELYSYTSFIKEEIINGLYKYTIGDFLSKEDADIFRINCGVSGAFILTYENGVRINKYYLNL